ncbi:hypothetical protein ERO13_A04G040000v2, partial [Gossypium hirsutum]
MNYNTCFHLLLAFFIPCSVLCLAMTARNLNSDQFALLEFKDRIAGPQNVLANNWTASTSVCNWIGVSCGILHKRVIALNLTSMNLRGTIPPHLGNLSFLLSLDLSSNNLYGLLPKELGQLHRLKILRLSLNSLNGEIPSWLGNLHRVRRLQMENNNFTGTIPQTLVNISNLEILNMGFNQLFGQAPSSIFKISSLKFISLFRNSLSGDLPNDMCQHLPKLEVLHLSLNELSGSIPSSLGKCSNLKYFSLYFNQFTGIIPRSIGNLTRLEELDLGLNNLEGSLPNDLCHLCPKLEGLYLDANELSGNIPSSIGECYKLQMLSLLENKFSGLIPKSIFNSTMLEGIYLYDNNLEGTLPPMIEAPKLNVLSLHRNKLRGNIPNSILNASMLKLLDLGDNFFSGPIPETFGNLRHLEWFRIANNYLTMGSTINHEWTFLSSLTNCKNLTRVDISENPLNGTLPTNIGNLSASLIYFYAINCELKGNIPMEIGNLSNLLLLQLDHNKLSGFIPTSIGGMRNLQGLDLSFNKLGGPILESLCGLERLYDMSLGLNKLHGSIPSYILSTFGGLQTLVFLDLSNNILHGHIPESFGGLISLTFLDLCNNNLSGVIPKSLQKLLYLKYFNVSLNRLEGEIPTKGCFSNFPSTSFMQNYALCGPPRLLVPPCKNDIHLRRISHAKLSRATSGFDEHNMLGSGSFGYVYKGRLSDGMEVAIKVFNLQIEGAFRSFDIECEAMRNIVHRNLVKVITCCSNVDFKALVLGFMSNGNLEKWLHSNSCFLDIIQRINIMVDVAAALEYLHSGHPTPIIHCDLKPSNILLDEDMVAHVGDFGIAKLLGEGDVVKQTMTLATIGYMAPEFGSTGIVSIKCDIYSYGIVLIETFTRKKPTDEIFGDEMTIRHWLALDCSAELPEERKEMKDVVVELKKIKQ